MKNSKLLELFRTLNKTELAELYKFSLSPYFNKGRKYPMLIKTLRKFYPEFSNKKITKKFIYDKLFPGKKYNDQVLRNMINGLMRLCENYLVYKHGISDKRDFHNVLATELQTRRLFKLSEKSLNKSEQLIKSGGLDTSYYKNLYEQEQTKRELDILQSNQRASVESLINASTSFFFYIILEMSQQMEEMIVLNHNWNAGFESKLTYEFLINLDMQNLLNFLKDNSYSNYEIIQLYNCHIKQMIDYKDEELFKELKILFNRSSHLLSRRGKYNMYLALANACIKLQEVNEIKYSFELLELYKEQLKLELYNTQEDSSMEQDLFRNILINALKLKEFDWAESFLDKYLGKLLPEYMDNMKNFSFSNLSFEKGDYESALEFISLVKYDTFVFKFDARTLILKIYYELNYFEQARFLIDSFRHFILENASISEYIKSVHLNFIKHVNDMIRLKENKKEFDIEKTKEEIKTTPVRNKEWLYDKINELNLGK